MLTKCRIGYKKEICGILNLLNLTQLLLFSNESMASEVLKMATRFMHNPVHINNKNNDYLFNL